MPGQLKAEAPPILWKLILDMLGSTRNESLLIEQVVYAEAHIQVTRDIPRFYRQVCNRPGVNIRSRQSLSPADILDLWR